MNHSAIEVLKGAGGTSANPSNVAAPGAAMHLVVISGQDPNADDTWSGTPKAIIAALRAAGHRVSTVGPLQKLETGWPRLKAWWHTLIGKTYLVIRDPTAVRRRAAPLAAALRALEPYDAVIALHAADAAIVRSSAPLVFVHDATLRRLLDFYPRYDRRRLTRSTIARGEALDRAALDNCARAIYSSAWAADAARDDYGTPDRKLRVHAFGPNLSLIPTDEDLRKAIANRGRGPCRLVFVGVDWLRKGGDTAIAVARLLNERGIACELDVVGADPPAQRPPWVRAHGFLPRGDSRATARYASLLARADFLILPTHADCTPIVLNEAAAYGLPIATTAVGGILEIVGDSGWARAFPAGTPAEPFADWIAQLYRDRADYERLAWLGRREYERRLNWAGFTRTLTATIEELRPAAAPDAKAAEFSQ